MADNKDNKDETTEEELDQTSDASEEPTSDAEDTSEETETVPEEEDEAVATENSEAESEADEDDDSDEEGEDLAASDESEVEEDEEGDEDDVFDDYLEDSDAEESEADEDDDEYDGDDIAAAGVEEDSDALDEESDAEDDDEVAEYGEETELYDADIDGLAAFFDDPNELMYAATKARDEGFDKWDAYSPFPIHGIEDAMGLGRSWLPWVTFAAGGTGFLLANLLQFGTLTFDWPMIIGGKPYAPWPSFVPIMFELTVLIGGVTTALVMLIASGCFRKPKIIDPEITNDRFVLWVSADDSKFDPSFVKQFMEDLDPVEIRPIKFD